MVRDAMMCCFGAGAGVVLSEAGHKPPRWICRRRQVSEPGAGKGRQRGQKRAALYGKLERYSSHFTDMLDLELKAEQEEVLERNAKWSRSRLESSGLSIFDVSFEDRPEQFGRLMFAGRLKVPAKMARARMMASAFKTGDLVQLSRGEEELIATVCRKYPFEILLSTTGPEAPSGDGWRVDQGTSTISYDRCSQALSRATTKGPGNLSDVDRVIVESFDADEVQMFYEQFKRSQSAVKSMRAPTTSRNLAWQQLALSKQSRLPPSWEKRTNAILNESPLSKSQTNAIRAALSRTLSLIQGPPGTGKTTTAGFLVTCAVALGLGPVMAVAHSNVGTDNLLKEFVKRRLRVVRVGNPICVPKDLQQYTVDAILGQNKQVAACQKKLNKATDSNRRKELARTLYDLTQQKTAEIVKQADVVVSTCVGSAMEFENLNFPFVLVDEASQSPEPCVGIPLQYECQQLCMIGDHHQLPPTVLSREAVKAGYDVSLFCRLTQNLKPNVLLTQYRMHPDLAALPSFLFYGGVVKSGDSTALLKLPQIPRQWSSKALHVIDIEGDDYQAHGEETYANPAQVEEVVRLLELLREAQIEPETVGVIAPYWGQLRKLLDVASDDPFLSSVEMNTCDGFQGREKDIILFSTVRCNKKGDIGFVSDWRRLNVSLTRSRSLLIVIGNRSTLCRGSQDWREWYKMQRVTGKPGLAE